MWGYQDGRIYHGHAFLINYLQLRYLLWHSGLRVERELFSPAMLLSSILFVVAERIPEAEREPPLVVEKHRRNFEAAEQRAAG